MRESYNSLLELMREIMSKKESAEKARNAQNRSLSES